MAYGYKDPNRPRGTVGEDNPLDAFMRPLTGGHDPYSLAALEGWEDLNKGPLPDMDTYKQRGEQAADEAYNAGAGAIQRGGEEQRSAISASYARRGLGGSGAQSAALSDAQAKTMAHLAEMAAGTRLQARQYYEQIGLSERAREIARRQFAMQMAYANQPGENQILPTFIGGAAYLGGSFLSGLGKGLGIGIGAGGVGGSTAARASDVDGEGADKTIMKNAFMRSRQGLRGDVSGGPLQVNYMDPYGQQQKTPNEMTPDELAWLKRNGMY